MGPGVETQVSMGAYRPYCKTLYWTCCSAVIFAILHIFAYFTFRALTYLAHFAFSHISHLTYCMHFVIPHSSCFCIFCISCTCISHTFRVFAHSCIFTHSRIFHALTHATVHLPRICRIPFTCPVLILQGPLVCISLCFTHITSYMSLHSHLCSLISLCVYITSPLYV